MDVKERSESENPSDKLDWQGVDNGATDNCSEDHDVSPAEKVYHLGWCGQLCQMLLLYLTHLLRGAFN